MEISLLSLLVLCVLLPIGLLVVLTDYYNPFAKLKTPGPASVPYWLPFGIDTFWDMFTVYKLVSFLDK